MVLLARVIALRSIVEVRSVAMVVIPALDAPARMTVMMSLRLGRLDPVLRLLLLVLGIVVDEYNKSEDGITEFSFSIVSLDGLLLKRGHDLSCYRTFSTFLWKIKSDRDWFSGWTHSY